MELIVKVKQGQLRGRKNSAKLDKTKIYYSFQGIPYAEPPTGKLRFQAPQPPEKWEGIYDATHEKLGCIQSMSPISISSSEDCIFNIQTLLEDKQFDNFREKRNDDGKLVLVTGLEDCLYLNVHTPKPPSEITEPLPVMVYIHGGSFTIGSGSEKVYSADFFIQENVILVTFNYRLHVLGFLNLGLSSCPGNAGLKDQLAALIWVKENIASFGGDPENITIFGESAGGTSVHYQTISPLSRSKVCFQKAIMQSGTALAPWALNHSPYDMAFKIGEKLGFKGTPKDRQGLLDFLMQQDASELVVKVDEVGDDLMRDYPARISIIPFLPSVEVIKDGAFLPDSPENLIKTAPPLPIMIGANSKEGLLVFTLDFQLALEMMRKDFSVVLKNNFKIDPKKLEHCAKKVRHRYLGNKEVDERAASEISDLFTDIFFYRFYESVENVIKSPYPVYIYEFAFDGGANMLNVYVKKKKKIDVKGAGHGDEIAYLFYPKGLFFRLLTKYGENELKVSKTMTTLWANFAKFGKPSSETGWKPSSIEKPAYLCIEQNLKLTLGTIYGERLQFLKKTLGPDAEPFDLF